MPTWLGDCVMATPALRGLRELYPDARITALVRVNVKPIVQDLPWVDRVVTVRPKRKGKKGDGRRGDVVGLARRLSRGRFDMAVLLPNSFKSALVAKMAGCNRIVGYERDGRGFLLSDRMIPRKGVGGFVPVPTLDYYLGIVRFLGAGHPSGEMALFTRAEDDVRVDEIFKDVGIDAASGDRLVLLNPGAQKLMKRWEPARFAAVADVLMEEGDVKVAVTGSPGEREILKAVVDTAKGEVINLAERGMNLRLLKSVVKKSALMVTNDTGPRHIAAAMGTPVVTLFGPTGPEWTTIDFEHEREIVADGICEVCLKEKWAKSGKCMHRISVDEVVKASRELLSARV